MTPYVRSILTIVKAAVEQPDVEGSYFLLAYEWVGLPSARNRDPSWSVRRWTGTDWERTLYTFDTGGYENFEPIAWARLPTVRPDFSN